MEKQKIADLKSFQPHSSARKNIPFHIIYEMVATNQKNWLIHVYIVGILPDNEFADIEAWIKHGTFKETIEYVESNFFGIDYIHYGTITMSDVNAKWFREKKELYVLKNEK